MSLPRLCGISLARKELANEIEFISAKILHAAIEHTFSRLLPLKTSDTVE